LYKVFVYYQVQNPNRWPCVCVCVCVYMCVCFFVPAAANVTVSYVYR
jgi:hypothetical protein